MTLFEYNNLLAEAVGGNDDTLISLYRMATDDGDVSAMGIVSCLYFLNNRIDADQEIIIPLLQKSLDADNPFGCYCYGCMLADGIGVEKDRNKAKKEMLYAAKAGIPRAMYVLGMLHYWDREFDDSYKWLYKAREMGTTEGLYILGLHFNNGWGCIQNKQSALKCFQEATSYEKDAFAMLAVYNYLGETIPKDMVKAFSYACSYANFSKDKDLQALCVGTDYGKWLLLLGKVMQRVNINNKTLLRVFSEAEREGNEEAAAIAAKLRPLVKEEEDEKETKELLEDVKEDWKDLLGDIIKDGLGLSGD